MSDAITIYHNPRCSKSRAALELLKANNREPEIIEYLVTPPSKETLESLLDMLGMEPRDLIRTHEKEYREAGLENPELSRADLIAAMIEHPRLIERPIVVTDGRAAIGRPPEQVLDLL
jgi:arsenate reductase